MISRVTALLIVAMAASAASAEVISSQLGSTGLGVAPYFGQGIVTSDGGPWTDISFSFDSQFGAGTTRYAAGDLFLLTEVYGGTPTDLGNATSGFVAMSNGITDGAWTFDSSVILDPNTAYYFYMGDRPNDASTVIYGALDNEQPGLASAASADSNYQGSNNDLDHLLIGRVVPEPASIIGWSLMMGLLGGIFIWKRQRSSISLTD